MIDLVNSGMPIAVYLREYTLPMARDMAELMFTDKDGNDCRYAQRILDNKVPVKGRTGLVKIFRENPEHRRVAVEGVRRFARDIQRNGINPDCRSPIRLGCIRKTNDLRLLDGHRRLSVLLALDRPAWALYPWEHEPGYRQPFGEELPKVMI